MRADDIHSFESRRALTNNSSEVQSEVTLYHGGQATSSDNSHMAFDGGEDEDDALVEPAQGGSRNLMGQNRQAN